MLFQFAPALWLVLVYFSISNRRKHHHTESWSMKTHLKWSRISRCAWLNSLFKSVWFVVLPCVLVCCDVQGRRGGEAHVAAGQFTEKLLSLCWYVSLAAVWLLYFTLSCSGNTLERSLHAAWRVLGGEGVTRTRKQLNTRARIVSSERWQTWRKRMKSTHMY